MLEHRRVVDQPADAVDDRRQLAHRLQRGPAPGLLDVGLQDATGPGAGDELGDRLDVEPGVPGAHVAEAGVAADPQAVGPDRGLGGRPRRGVVEPGVPAGDHDARRQPLDIPLPRPGQRFVEVVDVEDQVPLGRGEEAEVEQVGVVPQRRVR